MRTAFGAPETPDPTGHSAALAAATQLVGDLTALKAKLVAQNPAIQPLLDAVVDDFAACARMTIREMAEEGGSDDACK